MDQTPQQIEAHIDRTRERLGSNLRELETKVDAATDWRVHFRDRPGLFLGAAAVGGVVLAAALGPRSPKRASGAASVRQASDGSSARAEARQLWRNITGAFIGLASARLTAYIGEAVPGFDEQFRRVTQGTRGATT